MNVDIKQKIFYTTVIVLCFSTLIGYLLPLMSIDINIFDRVSQKRDISIKNIFTLRNESESPLNMTDLSGFTSGNGIISNITEKIINIISLYLAALIMIIAIIVTTILNKLKKASIVILMLSLAFYINIGIMASKLASDITTALEQQLGFLAIFYNFSDMINIKLGKGYWLTVTSICFLIITMALNVFIFKQNRYRKKAS